MLPGDLAIVWVYGYIESMKTTIELPEQRFRRAKAAVARRGMTLKEFFTRAAKRELERLECDARDPSPESSPAWHRLLQKPSAAELKELERIDQVIETEFSSIDADSWE